MIGLRQLGVHNYAHRNTKFGEHCWVAGRKKQNKTKKEKKRRLLCRVYIRKPRNKPVDQVAAAQETATISGQTEVIILQACRWSRWESKSMWPCGGQATCPTSRQLNNPGRRRTSGGKLMVGFFFFFFWSNQLLSWRWMTRVCFEERPRCFRRAHVENSTSCSQWVKYLYRCQKVHLGSRLRILELRCTVGGWGGGGGFAGCLIDSVLDCYDLGNLLYGSCFILRINRNFFRRIWSRASGNWTFLAMQYYQFRTVRDRLLFGGRVRTFQNKHFGTRTQAALTDE